MDNFDQNDYECLPPSASVTTHMIAGAMAGIMEHCVMYPVDCVKVGVPFTHEAPTRRTSPSSPLKYLFVTMSVGRTGCTMEGVVHCITISVL